MADRSSALIVGASRGLGLALAEEWLKRDARVIATVRSTSQQLKTLQDRFPGSLEIEIVDIADVTSVRALRDRLDNRTFDVLFVNAGICKANEENALDRRRAGFPRHDADERPQPDAGHRAIRRSGPRERRARRDDLRTGEHCWQPRLLGALQFQQGGP